LTQHPDAVYFRAHARRAADGGRSAARIVATVSHYYELLQTIRDRVSELGITHETLDAVAGLQSGYASKLLANPPIKRMGAFTQFIVLQALGMK
jgi:hypothetical protein